MKLFPTILILLLVGIRVVSQNLYLSRSELLELDSLEQAKDIKDRHYIKVKSTTTLYARYARIKPNKKEKQQGIVSQTIRLVGFYLTDPTVYRIPSSAIMCIVNRDSVEKARIKKRNDLYIKKAKEEKEELNRKQQHEDSIYMKMVKGRSAPSGKSEPDSISEEKHEPNSEILVSGETLYKVSKVRWLGSDNGIIDKVDVNLTLTVNKAKDVLTTSIPILDGQFHTKFKILHSVVYDLTGIPAMVYGTKVVNMDIINTESLKRIHIMISDKLIIKVD